MFEGQPKGLFALALANTGERFGYYTMLAVFALFLRANFGLEPDTAGLIYSCFLGLVYFLPLVGGAMADKYGFGKMVTIGVFVMFVGYLLLSLPLGGDTLALIVMSLSLLLIGFGTGLFKGNLQVMVGDLYSDPKFASKRDSGFSLFYMAINIGALFAPTAAVEIMKWAQNDLGYSVNDSYHFAFAVACASLILSIAIYYLTRSTFRHVEGGVKKSDAQAEVEDLPAEENKARIVALCLVFAVVIFFWMAFHQNGLTLTYFADEFTTTQAFGFDTMVFDVWNLVCIIIAVFAIVLSSKSEKAIIENVNAIKEMMMQFQADRKGFETSMHYFLSEMDKKAERIEEISRQTKESVNDSVKRVFESQFPNQDEALRNNMMAGLMSNPDALSKLAASLPELQKVAEQLKNN